MAEKTASRMPLHHPPRSVTVVHMTAADFRNARLEGFRKAELPDGALAAVPGRSRSLSSLTSAPLEAAVLFDQVLAGANASLGPKDAMELSVRVRAGGRWSPWFRFGGIGPGGRAASAGKQENSFGRMDTDVLTLKRKADGLRYRVVLRTAPGSKAFLKLVSLTFTDNSAPYDAARAERDPLSSGPVRLKVPAISQMVQRAPCARDICSPTSLAMVLRHFGLKAGALATAAAVFDHDARIYGNWTLNTMYAGCRGLYAWPARFDSLEEARSYLESGIPIVVSLTFGPGELKRSPLKSTRGHLMVLRGFDARGRALVNDPASPDTAGVPRVYERKEFARAWLRNKFGTAYVITPLERMPLTAKAPFAELYSRPPGVGKKERTRHIETQVLPLERVDFMGSSGGWLKVSAAEQPRQEKPGVGFRPYSGWIRSGSEAFRLFLGPDAVVRSKKARLKGGPVAELSMGARVRVLRRGKDSLARVLLPGGAPALIREKDLNFLPCRTGKTLLRRRILATARQFLGDKYYWGGRSGYGTDCSGLVNLSYRVWGMDLPRNASDQYVHAGPLRGRMRPADLIFSTAKSDPARINHVMLYSGGEKLIEATQESGSVREVTFRKKFGADLAGIRNGSMVNGRRVFFRTIL
ncbi:MAG TPA: C39 family peptidase [Elusimicrobiales bacterium]|nr:C39 family peptidase [Elusimicrobiales bacterium]